MAKNKIPRGTYEEVKILALAAVENPDLEYFERQVHRAFSTTFHVSILEAEGLTIEYMLQHIYEWKFEQQKLGDRVDEALELLKSPEERKEEERQDLLRLDEDETYLIRESLKPTKPPPKTQPKPPEIPDHLPDLPTLKFEP